MLKNLKIALIFLLALSVCGCDGRTVGDYSSKEVFNESAVVSPVEETGYDKGKLKNEIVNITESRPENWSVYVDVPLKNFNLEINNRVVTAASTIKLFNMVTLYNEIHQGNIVMDDELKEYVTDMITISSNNASNEVVKAIGGGDFDIGAEKVTSFAHSMGCADTQEQHMLYDVSGSASGKNTTSVKDCGEILRKIYYYNCVTPEYDNEMVELLKQQTCDWKIPSGVPEGITVANKTGENSRVELDAAIVYSPECDYILCISVTDFGGTDVYPVFTQISEATYNFFNGEKTAQPPLD